MNEDEAVTRLGIPRIDEAFALDIHISLALPHFSLG